MHLFRVQRALAKDERDIDLKPGDDGYVRARISLPKKTAKRLERAAKKYKVTHLSDVIGAVLDGRISLR